MALPRRAGGVMHLSEIWRYPVKSMAGERLGRAEIGPFGIVGDRVVHVENPDARVITARTHPRLLRLHARLNGTGEPMVDGRAWTEPGVLAAVRTMVGEGARLVRDESVSRFDVLPLLVATDGAIAQFGHDGRRLRPNLVIGGVPGLEERAWPGRKLRVGDVLIALADLRARCVMTTVDPDTLEQDHRILRGIVERFGGRLALNASVIQGGFVSEGDAVELL